MDSTVATQRPSFTRLGTRKDVMPLIREAKRVNYTVAKTDFSFIVTDPDHANALVLRAVRVKPTMWAVTYSTAYWKEPTP